MELRWPVAKRALHYVLRTKAAFILALAMPGMIGVGSGIATAQTVEVPGQAAPFFLNADEDPADRAQATECLAQAVYYEAGFEPVDGQRAVAQVVLNRVRDPNFPQTICGVVYEGWQRKTGCQFTFVCDGSLKRRPPTAEELSKAMLVAEDALNGYVETTVGTATHYHTEYVDPYWKRSLVEVAQIGQHIFYKWPGHAGEPEALTAPYAGDEVAVRDEIHPGLTPPDRPTKREVHASKKELHFAPRRRSHRMA